MKTTGFIMATAACILLAAGCSKSDRFFKFEGPRYISSDEQTVEYVPKDSPEYWITGVYYQVNDISLEGGPTIAQGEADFSNGHWRGDWFDVWIQDRNIVVHVQENPDDGHLRSLSIHTGTELYFAPTLSLDQLPYGKELDE